MFVHEKLKLVWTRITFSKLTIFYFAFSLVHFFLQVAFQSRALFINANAADFLWSVVTQGDATALGSGTFPILEDDLRLCNSSSMKIDECQVIWSQNSVSGNSYDVSASQAESQIEVSFSSAAPSSTTVVATSTSAPSPAASTIVNTAPVAEDDDDDDEDEEEDDDEDDDDDFVEDRGDRRVGSLELATSGGLNLGVEGANLTLVRRQELADLDSIFSFVDVDGQVKVVLDGQGYAGTAALLDRTCLWALNYPVGVLQNTKREDIVFLCFHFWVLGMSIVALLNESIPHILASLATHVAATAWAGFQLAHTARFRRNFSRVITNGACSSPAENDANGFLLSGYWVERSKAEIPILALNVLALGISVLLTWKLVKSFGWQTFKRVGASRQISRIYKFVLTLSITIQLSVFFMAATVGLWLDQLWNGPIGRLAAFKQMYQIVFMVVGVLLIPWLMTGWFAVRRELKIPMLAFLVLCVGYFAGWGAMFLSDAFRWTYLQWYFFGIMACTSVLLTLISFVLGLICRWNFDRGLPRYLKGDQTLSDKDEFLNVPPLIASSADRDIEKVAFPSQDTAIPTYAAAYDTAAPPYAAMGPRFYNNSVPSFDQQYPSTNGYHHRSPSENSSHSNTSPISAPGSTYVSPIEGPRRGAAQLHRFNSNSSSSSHGSSNASHGRQLSNASNSSRVPKPLVLNGLGKRISQSSTNSSESRRTVTDGGKKRWVIE